MTLEEERNCEGLTYLTWDMFDSPDEPGSGWKFMERDCVQILDRVTHKTKMILNIQLGYVSPKYARMKGMTTHDSHRIGKAVRIRIKCKKKRMKLVAALILEGVRRIAIDRELIYFDTDKQKKDEMPLWC